MYRITFNPIGRRGYFSEKQSLLDCTRQLGVDLISICGGEGTCGRCKLVIEKGHTSEITRQEKEKLSKNELNNGYRLACQTFPLGDCEVSIPPKSIVVPQRIEIGGEDHAVLPEPVVHTYNITIKSDSRSNILTAEEMLTDTLYNQCNVRIHSYDLDALRNLRDIIFVSDGRVSISVRKGEVIAVHPGGIRQLGLAVDIGTSTIVGYLIDLEEGKSLAAKGIMNPQISEGEDIITRLNLVLKSPEKSMELSQLVIYAINQIAVDLCQESKTSLTQIVDTVIVGNTAMHHLFLRLPVKQLVASPFVPALRGQIDVKVRDVGLYIAPGGYVHFLPNIAGFVGADHAAALLAAEIIKSKSTILLLDIGTNTEISLVHAGRITTVSCASGPAMEGGHIKDGMRAAFGAIEKVKIKNGKIHYKTIGNTAPIGICGSGMLDVLAQLYLAGILDNFGKLKESALTKKNDGKIECVIKKRENGNPAITVTQQDIRELQLAKAAISTGIKVLLESNGLLENDISRVIIAGAFGTYIDIPNAIAIGMLPNLPLKRFKQSGNLAGVGARLALISERKRKEAQRIANLVNYLEMARYHNFQQIFMQSLLLGDQ